MAGYCERPFPRPKQHAYHTTKLPCFLNNGARNFYATSCSEPHLSFIPLGCIVSQAVIEAIHLLLYSARFGRVVHI